MTKTASPPQVSIDRGFELLCSWLQKRGPEAQKRIMAHVRAATGRATPLPTFHNDRTVDEATKRALYQDCVKALVEDDYKKLKGGIAAGDKRTDPLENKQAAQPTTTEPPAESTTPTPMPQPRRQVKPVVESTTSDEPQDDLTALLLKRLSPHLKHQSTPLDEDRVRELVADIVGDKIASIPKSIDELRVADIALDTVKHALSNGEFPVDRVKGIIQETLAGMVMRVVVTQPDGSVRDIPRQHYKFPLLAAAISARLNIALVGPAGGGKTTMAHAAATAHNLDYEAISVGPMTSKSDLFGFIDANGRYHDTGTVRRAEKGGVMLWDEFDAANAGVATYGNMLLANNQFATPTGMRNKHKDFVLIAGLNTYGMGANRVYVGRNQLDGATLDRFVTIDIDYDEGLEAAIVGLNKPSPVLKLDEGGLLQPAEWLDYVTRLRKACETQSIRHIISPRATIHGTKLFAAGVGRKHVEEMVLWKGIEQATKVKILSALPQ
jgi:hypothetical protein